MVCQGQGPLLSCVRRPGAEKVGQLGLMALLCGSRLGVGVVEWAGRRERAGGWPVLAPGNGSPVEGSWQVGSGQRREA